MMGGGGRGPGPGWPRPFLEKHWGCRWEKEEDMSWNRTEYHDIYIYMMEYNWDRNGIERD